MLHHIIVKWKEPPADQAATLRDIQMIFNDAMTIPGVQGVRLIPNVVDRPNRYDLMIVLKMDRSALEAYDHSQAHLLWKERYSELIAQKAIFDCD